MNDFPWRRVWTRSDAIVELDQDGFFPARVVEPSGPWGRIPHVTWLDQLDRVRCLVLLGEPGMGKSHELALERRRLGLRGDVAVISRDLNEGSAESELSEGLETELRRCLDEPGKGVFLLVDSLDVVERGAGGAVRRISRILSGLLPEDRGRVSLRLTCRGSDWMPVEALDAQLQKAFAGGDPGFMRFARYRLEPLQRGDVERAAEIRGVPVQEFLAGLRRTRTQSLASVPVTLNILLGRAKRGLDFGDDPAALYRDALKQLCNEHDETRDGALDPGRPTPERLCELAEHVAAFVTLAGATVRERVGSEDDEPVESLTVHDLSQGVTAREGPPRQVPDGDVRALLRTALFTRQHRGAQFAHRTYQEFLTAECLATRGHDAESVRRLLRDGDAVSHRIAPHLRGTAAWCATMMPAFVRLIAADEPAVLLRGGVRHLSDDASKESATERLFEALARDKLTLDYQEIAYLDELAHPRMGAQLHPYLTDPGTPHNVWQIALAIARKCSVPLPFEDLARIALDSGVPERRRVGAAELLMDAAPVGVRRPLQAVLQEPGLGDHLRGALLHALWPDAMSAEELAEALVPERDPGTVTTNDYFSFVHNRLFERLAPEHLPPLLRRVSAFAPLPLRGVLEAVSHGLMRRAWELAPEREDVTALLSEALAARLVSLAEEKEEFAVSPLTRSDLPADRERWPGLSRDKRRKVVAGVLEYLANRGTPDGTALKVFDILFLCDWPYVFLEDRPWVAAQAAGGPTASTWGLMCMRLDEREELVSAMYCQKVWTGERGWLDTIREELPWVQRARSWRVEISHEGPAGNAPAAPSTAKGPGPQERRRHFNALRDSVLGALGRTRLPVRGDEDLLEAVIASIGRLERRLQGETPLAFSLWNEAPDKRCRPKTEDDLSDLVRDHLLTDLHEVAVLVTREPEIDRGAGYLDLDVRVTNGREPIARVIIEVKATWNRELVEALGSQLVGRYMQRTQSRCGLYLVGDFSSPYWDKDDDRRGDAKRGSKHLPEMVAAAVELSKRPGVRAAVLPLNCSLDRLRRVANAGRTQ